MDLDSLRRQIDEIDGEMLELFLRRMKICREIARYKIENNLPVLHPEREREIIEEVRQKSGTEFAAYGEEFFRGVLSLSRRIQDEAMGQLTIDD